MQTPIGHIDVELALVASDIGGTADTSKYVDMDVAGAVTFIVQLGNTFEGTPAGWDAADQLDGFKLVQATSAAGAGSKDITGAANIQAAVNAAGERHAITVNAEALDVANSFTHVACTVSEAGNTGVDLVNIIAIRHSSRFKHAALGASSHVIV